MHLSELDVLVVDCQATFAGERGHLLELGWAVAGRGGSEPCAQLIRLPSGERVPPGVVRVTGISDGMLTGASTPEAAWRELKSTAASLAHQPAPAVAHFAQFERPFLERLAGGPPPLELVCTHDIARRLLPTLPRRSLRALAGYFGRAVPQLRRSAEHVEATAFVWRALIPLLADAGVERWSELVTWLKAPASKAEREWPMPRALRLSLPDRPGLYRMLRTSGDVLYVGKATSLHHRVNSYFRKRSGIHERTMEMLAQARNLTFEVTGSPLEAALLEPDEIKRLAPPYNVALTEAGRRLWFATPALERHRAGPGEGCEVGPFPREELLEQLVALSHRDVAALGRGRWAPSEAVFADGLARFLAANRERELRDLTTASLLSLGGRLWREGRRDRDEPEATDAEAPTPEPRRRGARARSRARRERDAAPLLQPMLSGLDARPAPAMSASSAAGAEPAPTWTPELVMTACEWLALRAALALRRARWFTRLAESAVTWSEPDAEGPRLLVLSGGDVAELGAAPSELEPPIPPGHARAREERHLALTIARFDRLRVLTTELKRLVADGSPVALRFGPAPAHRDDQLARVLEWL
jgi:DNA polymerase-3 subunit epsilon